MLPTLGASRSLIRNVSPSGLWFRDSFNRFDRARPVDSACYGALLQRNKLHGLPSCSAISFDRRHSNSFPHYLHRLNSYCALYVYHVWRKTRDPSSVPLWYFPDSPEFLQWKCSPRKKTFAQCKLYYRRLHRIFLKQIGPIKILWTSKTKYFRIRFYRDFYWITLVDRTYPENSFKEISFKKVFFVSMALVHNALKLYSRAKFS